jgi:trehalose-6-phosphate synthase
VTVLLVATPSRGELASYQELEQEVIDATEAINARWGSEAWRPIVLEHRNVAAAELAGMYRAADVCLVSSLQDGMNLVAKEFLACNVDEQGVLVLSRLTGAAEEIEGAVLINPFNVDGVVEGLREAITMPFEDRRRRMAEMRTQLCAATIFDWLEAILARVDELAVEAADPGAPTRAPMRDAEAPAGVDARP